MEKFTTLEGVAAPMKIINVDTDMVIPKQYLKTIKRTGLGRGLFSEMRYKDDGSENPDFVLNKPAYRKAKILACRRSFSSRTRCAGCHPGTEGVERGHTGDDRPPPARYGYRSQDASVGNDRNPACDLQHSADRRSRT